MKQSTAIKDLLSLPLDAERIVKAIAQANGAYDPALLRDIDKLTESLNVFSYVNDGRANEIKQKHRPI